MKYINCTPHPIVLNDGRRFEPSGSVARVGTSFTSFENDVCSVVYGELENVPAPVEDTLYIVSAMVLSSSDRKDLVAPATGHPETIRNEKGWIVSVPGFVRG
jgi:hypothetical protein